MADGRRRLNVAAEFGVWDSTAAPQTPLPTLHDDVECDVLVIGAGYTGLSTALHLAERRVDCVVLEAQVPGWGGSGRNTGWLEPNWWTKQPAHIVAMHGADRAARLSHWVASGPRLLADWERRYELDVQRDQRGILLATDDERRALTLESEARDWQALGVPNAYLTRETLRDYVPLAGYCGALLLAEGATLNPLSLARELARASAQLGVRLFVRSPAITIERERERWCVATPTGTVRASRLVLATDAYTRALWPELTKSFAVWHLAVIASTPGAGVDDLLPGRAAFADLALGNVFTLRSARGDRLVTSTFAPVRRSLSAEVVARPFMRKFRRLLPAHRAPRWEHVHFGEIALSADMLPRLCQIGPDAWTAYGYSGTGMNFALLLGGELARLAAGEERVEPLFPLQPLVPLRLRHAVELGLRYVHAPVARHVVSRLV